jgi:hypothetical protein
LHQKQAAVASERWFGFIFEQRTAGLVAPPPAARWQSDYAAVCKTTSFLLKIQKFQLPIPRKPPVFHLEGNRLHCVMHVGWPGVQSNLFAVPRSLKTLAGILI